ncbi:UNVERIFIED_CONTAM: hypothetical protein FKN15_037496 [Acipenser sinensis]
MGGVDLPKKGSKKWNHRMVFHFLDMTVVTAWPLYRWDCDASYMLKEEQIRLYSFKSYIAQSLCKCGKNLERKRGCPSGGISSEYEEKRRRQGPTAPIPFPDVRLDGTSHWAKKRGDAGDQDARALQKSSAGNVMSTSASQLPATAS